VRRRIAALAVIAAGLMLALAGCTFFAPQATLIHYDASDGVGINVGDIQVRNALVISPNGTDANFVGAFINTSSKAQNVNVQYTSHAGGKTTKVTETVKLGPSLSKTASISYGNPGVPQLVFRGADVKPGSLLRLFIQYGGVSGKMVLVPVLDGTQSIYSGLTPSPVPTPTPCPTPTATQPTVGGPAILACSTPTPTATPTPKATSSTN
jgi:hypothetical protein